MLADAYRIVHRYLILGRRQPKTQVPTNELSSAKLQNGHGSIFTNPPPDTYPITCKLQTLGIDISPGSWSRIAADSYLRGPKCRIPVKQTSMVAQARTTCMLGTCTHSSTRSTAAMDDGNLSASSRHTRFGVGLPDLIMFIRVCRCNKIRIASVEGPLSRTLPCHIWTAHRIHSRTRHTKTKVRRLLLSTIITGCKKMVLSLTMCQTGAFTVSSVRKRFKYQANFCALLGVGTDNIANALASPLAESKANKMVR